jgi:hypothetical protein
MKIKLKNQWIYIDSDILFITLVFDSTDLNNFEYKN